MNNTCFYCNHTANYYCETSDRHYCTDLHRMATLSFGMKLTRALENYGGYNKLHRKYVRISNNLRTSLTENASQEKIREISEQFEAIRNELLQYLRNEFSLVKKRHDILNDIIETLEVNNLVEYSASITNGIRRETNRLKAIKVEFQRIKKDVITPLPIEKGIQNDIFFILLTPDGKYETGLDLEAATHIFDGMLIKNFTDTKHNIEIIYAANDAVSDVEVNRFYYMCSKWNDFFTNYCGIDLCINGNGNVLLHSANINTPLNSNVIAAVSEYRSNL